MINSLSDDQRNLFEYKLNLLITPLHETMTDDEVKRFMDKIQGFSFDIEVHPLSKIYGYYERSDKFGQSDNAYHSIVLAYVQTETNDSVNLLQPKIEDIGNKFDNTQEAFNAYVKRFKKIYLKVNVPFEGEILILGLAYGKSSDNPVQIYPPEFEYDKKLLSFVPGTIQQRFKSQRAL